MDCAVRDWRQCILEEVCVAPSSQGGVHWRSSDIVLKWIVAGPKINRLHEFEGVQGHENLLI